MTLAFTSDSPVSPDHFRGRRSIIKQVCQRLQNSQLLSTSLVGGPKTGRTSILRYLESEQGGQEFPPLANFARVFFQGETAGTTMRPPEFWVGVLKELLHQVLPGEVKDAGTKAFQKARSNLVNLYDLEEIFDAAAKAKRPVLLLIDDFDQMLANQNFWPPHDFFHHVRSLANGTHGGWLSSSPRRALCWICGTRARGPRLSTISSA